MPDLGLRLVWLACTKAYAKYTNVKLTALEKYEPAQRKEVITLLGEATASGGVTLLLDGGVVC